jgi:multidrug efflux system membrane fusion protein
MKRRSRIVVPILILAAGVVGIGLLAVFRPKVEARPPPTVAPLVRVVVAERSDVPVRVRTQGTVVPRTESDLVPQVAGEVVWVSPKLVSGGFFEKDDPLVRIDRGDYEVERRSASAAVARVRSEFERAGTELERQRRLKERGVASQARIDDAENAYTVADAALREAQARLTRARHDLERTELRAPFRGRVRSKDVDVGQFVNRGAPIGVLYAVDWAEVRLPLPDRELRWLDLPLGYTDQSSTEGPPVTLRAEFAGRLREWQGRIVRTEGEIDARSRMVHVVARVEDPYGHDASEDHVPLAVGLFVDAEITGRTIPGAFVLPRAVLQSDGSGAEVVHVVDGENHLHVRPVQVLRTEREQVVIGRGLEDGDRVSISPLPAVVDGMAVRIPAEAPPTPVAAPASGEKAS